VSQVYVQLATIPTSNAYSTLQQLALTKGHSDTNSINAISIFSVAFTRWQYYIRQRFD